MPKPLEDLKPCPFCAECGEFFECEDHPEKCPKCEDHKKGEENAKEQTT